MRTNTLEDIRDRSAYALADDADTMCPDNRTSPGAVFLRRVRDSVLEQVEYSESAGEHLDWGDVAHELADSAVPIYTHDRMLTYVDLGAYREDLSEFGNAADGVELAGWALYEIARRLVDVLANELTTEDDQ